MPKITFIEPSGNQQVIDADVGTSLMQTATYNGVDGILAECGGSCACATCHVYIGEEFTRQLPPLGDYEDEMLNDAISPRQTTSRLSCQISVTDEMEGLVVEIAPQQ